MGIVRTGEENGDSAITRTKMQKLAQKYGHRILTMPPYNPDLNPIGGFNFSFSQYKLCFHGIAMDLFL